MTTKELFGAIGLLDDDLVLAADAPVKRRSAWRQILPLAACLCLCVALTRLSWWKVNNATSDSSAAVTADMAAPREEAATGPEVQEKRSTDSSSGMESAPVQKEPARADCYPAILNSQKIAGLDANTAYYEAALSPGSEAKYTVAAGTVLVLTDADGAGAAFGSRCTLEVTSDGPVEIGYVPSDDPEAPVVLQSGSGELSAALPDGYCYFFLANTGDQDVTVMVGILSQ